MLQGAARQWVVQQEHHSPAPRAQGCSWAQGEHLCTGKHVAGDQGTSRVTSDLAEHHVSICSEEEEAMPPWGGGEGGRGASVLRCVTPSPNALGARRAPSTGAAGAGGAWGGPESGRCPCCPAPAASLGARSSPRQIRLYTGSIRNRHRTASC